MSPSTPEAAAGRPPRAWARFLARLRAAPLLVQGEDALHDGERSWPGFAAWCEANPGRSCALWLAPALLHELVCDEGLPLADDAAALEWARPLLLHYHGDAAAAWPLAAWQQGRRRGVSALHGLRLDAVRETARRHRVALARVAPWWSHVLPLALARHAELREAAARLLLLDGARMAVLELQRGVLAGLQLRHLDAATPRALTDWCAEQGAGTIATVAVGWGLADGRVDGVRLDPGLHAAHPTARWLGGVPA